MAIQNHFTKSKRRNYRAIIFYGGDQLRSHCEIASLFMFEFKNFVSDPSPNLRPKSLGVG